MMPPKINSKIIPWTIVMNLKYSIASLLIILGSCSQYVNKNESDSFDDAIYQYGTKDSFLSKKYVGQLSYKELKNYGDMGLGTFNYVDGEMTALNGEFFRIPTDGPVHLASDTFLTPLAITKFFRTDKEIKTNSGIGIEELKNLISASLTDTTKPIAFQITGDFNFIKTRSVHKQSEPFLSLEQIVADQAVFQFENISATIVGFWFPKYMDGVNFPSYHFHVLTADLKGGGHLLDCKIKDAVVKIDYCDKLIIQ
ncbi:MAG: hypothetical protein CVV23_07805 [Ignavibacteriae bacterium HGW-Ignavibacteriae-2]|jgi:acetolactate decarboxylase|nr:MAG: hypothetical protein CVV23_07805 [Ignavibacteriae bacterium HGW-Ignavibacteriae-2]